MIKLKYNKKPEIKVAELLFVIRNIRWEYGHHFSYNGTRYSLFLVPQEDHEKNNSQEIALCVQTTSPNKWAMYLLETIPSEERSRILFHEIAECNLRYQKFSNEEAHEIALQEEENFFGPREN